MLAASLQHVDAEYGRTQVLSDVSLSVHAGELWAVLGPNGAGKSALAKILVGALKASRGTVQVCGLDASTTAPQVLARDVAWVPQTLSDDSTFTALELVLMGRTPHAGSWGLVGEHEVMAAMQALERLGVGSLAKRPLNHVSGGERRRVFIARALVQAPKLMVLDEPTAFLDVRHQIEALAIVQGAVSSTMAAVAVLHDVNVASRFASHAVLLREGRVVASGPVAQVMTAALLSQVYGVQMRQQPGWGPA
jgi:iron complex transport system ATP-binding protein